jgi:hypothetical protein
VALKPLADIILCNQVNSADFPEQIKSSQECSLDSSIPDPSMLNVHSFSDLVFPSGITESGGRSVSVLPRSGIDAVRIQFAPPYSSRRRRGTHA